MGEKQNVIEINGRRYDAASGKPVAADPKQSVKKVDGVSQPRRLSSRHSSRSAKSVHKSAKRSQTLNRQAARKPRKPRVVSEMNSAAENIASPTRSRSDLAKRVSPARKKRAVAQSKSPSVGKFKAPVTKAVGALPTPPDEVEADIAPMHHAPKQLSAKEQLIAERLAATDNTAPPSGKRRIRDFFAKRPRTVTILATGASVLLLVGYITYLNIPNMALRVAAARAGFEANMPGYRPNGFKFSGPISYSPGQITIKFDSNTDDRSYTITERETNWDSQSLLENFVKSETDLYSTFQERGLTVFIYDGSNAAWVNGGIWYTIAGDASLLNSEQLLKIASSL